MMSNMSCLLGFEKLNWRFLGFKLARRTRWAAWLTGTKKRGRNGWPVKIRFHKNGTLSNVLQLD
jgi:hypothetical protein